MPICPKLRAVVLADVVAWLVTAGLFAANPEPDTPMRLGFFIALQVASLLLAVALLPWLFGDVLRDLFERYCRDYFGVYVTGYLKGAASTQGDGEPATLTLVGGGGHQ